MRTASIKHTNHLKEIVSKVACEADEQLTHFGKEAVRIESDNCRAIEDRVNTAKRALKHGYRTTENFVDDTTHQIKRNPLRALGFSFVAGAAAGWFLPHRTRG
jgi:ElaB/YqjD/DUF883 family membrane-anchored ribosome-binding protein